SDGALWFTLSAGGPAGSIARITTSGTATLVLQGITRPRGITAGPDGALWFCNDDAIGRMTIDGDVTMYQTSSAMSPSGSITVGSDGALWFPSGPDAIVRMTTDGTATRYSFVVPVDNETTQVFLGEIAAGSDGALWFTIQAKEFGTIPHPFIGRTTTAGVATIFPLSTPGVPLAIAGGPDGALWFTNSPPMIGRITPGGTVTAYPYSGTDVGGPTITAGPD